MSMAAALALSCFQLTLVTPYPALSLHPIHGQHASGPPDLSTLRQNSSGVILGLPITIKNRPPISK